MSTHTPSLVQSSNEHRLKRFNGTTRLLGSTGLTQLQSAHVAVIGLGGVGSWAAECLARSGVGRLTLIDLDVIAESNINRQIHAQDSTLGADKITVMANRIAAYAPDCQVNTVDDWITPENVATLVPLDADIVLDCIDQVLAKVALVVLCQSRQQALIVCGAAGGKTNLSLLATVDLSKVTHDPLLASLRSRLRKQHGFTAAPIKLTDKKNKLKSMNVPCIYVAQAVAKPIIEIDVCVVNALHGLNCAGYGSMMHMTASMGLSAAAWAIERITMVTV
jgi:tRNA A37 threonylcarbamoyladenosine dehydratase